MFKQCDNLGLSLQSCLGSISRNPRHAELRPKAGTRASKPTGDVSLFLTYDNQYRQQALSNSTKVRDCRISNDCEILMSS